MNTSLLTGLDTRRPYDSSVVRSAVHDPFALCQAAVLSLGLILFLAPGSSFAAALPSAIDAEVVRGFALDAGSAKAEATASAPATSAAVNLAPATTPAADAPAAVASVGKPVAQPAAPEVRAPASSAPEVAKAEAYSDRDRGAMDPQMILGLARPAAQQAPAAAARAQPEPVAPKLPSPQAATVPAPAPMAAVRMPARPAAEPATPTPAASTAPVAAVPQQPYAPPPGISPMDAGTIRGFANTQMPPTGQPAAPTASVGKPAVSSELKPLSQADLDQLRSIFAPEM